MRYRIKIVPDETPNADGEWITVDAEAPRTTSWVETVTAMEPRVPKGYHIVALGGRVVNRFAELDL